MTQRKSYVIGVGMTKFEKPRGRADYPEIGLEAATKALLDAGVCYDEIEEAFVGYCCALHPHKNGKSLLILLYRRGHHLRSKGPLPARHEYVTKLLVEAVG